MGRKLKQLNNKLTTICEHFDKFMYKMSELLL